MLPKWHALFGILISFILYFFTTITLFEVSLFFLASVLIDFDHYVWYVLRKRNWSLKKAYHYLKDLPKDSKPVMMFIHTIEFHIFTGLLIFFWEGFLFILLGMIYHSVLDIITNPLKREFSFIKYLISDKNKYL